jgi:hypothetical protein
MKFCSEIPASSNKAKYVASKISKCEIQVGSSCLLENSKSAIAPKLI